MTEPLKEALHSYLTAGRDALRWKLEGLGEYDARRPLTPTGLNLLGLNYHVAMCAAGYFGETFERPFDIAFPDFDEDPHADFVVPAQTSTAGALEYVAAAWQHADATIDALELNSPGRVAHWPAERAEVTLGQILVHMTAETHRHAGHADILREALDGSRGLRTDNANLPEDGFDWAAHSARVETSATEAARRHQSQN